jgi:hypothetical protein
VVELETVELYSSDRLDDVYRLGAALYDVGIPSYIANADAVDLPSADEGGQPQAGDAGEAPFKLSIYPQDKALADDIVEETFGA